MTPQRVWIASVVVMCVAKSMMVVVRMLVIIQAMFIVITIAQNYDVSFDRMVLKYYDPTLAGNNSVLQFRKINRTSFALNISFDLLADLDGRDIEVTATFYQLLSNVYRYIGMNLTINACDIWRRDLFHGTTRLKEYGNLEGCDIKKGHYYLYNYIPDSTFKPENMIWGQFKVVYTAWFKSTGKAIIIYHWLVGTNKRVKTF